MLQNNMNNVNVAENKTSLNIWFYALDRSKKNSIVI